MSADLNLQFCRSDRMSQMGLICRHFQPILLHAAVVVLVVAGQWFGVGLVIERSLVRLPAWALSSQLGQLSLPSLRGR